MVFMLSVSAPPLYQYSKNKNDDGSDELKCYSTDAPEAGQLTEIGCQQMESVGTRLRERYVDELGYLPSHFVDDSDSIHYNCTNMRRTIHSADNLLCGLYPMDKRKDGALIPLFVDHQNFTYLNPSTMSSVCPKLKMKKRENLDLILNKLRKETKMNDMIDVVMLHYRTDPDTLNISGYDVVFDSMYCKIAHQMDDVPKVFTQNNMDEMARYMAMIHISMMNLDRETLKLAWGNTLREMLKMMVSEKGKFVVSSCHDNSLLAVLCSLYGHTMFAREPKWPYYADFITFEVWEDTKSGLKYVRVLYNLEVLEEFDMIGLGDLQNSWADLVVDSEEYLNDLCKCQE